MTAKIIPIGGAGHVVDDVLGATTEQTVSGEQRYAIKTEEGAERVVEMLLAGRDIVARRRAALERCEREQEQLEAFYAPLLREYAEAHPPRRGKTVHLATGDLSLRLVRGHIDIRDEERAKEWARRHVPAAIRASFVEQLDRAAARVALEHAFSVELSRNLHAAAFADLDDAERFTAAHRAATEHLLREAGAVMTEDREDFHVRAPRATTKDEE